jgi:uncharacterized membrane protein YccC
MARRGNSMPARTIERGPMTLSSGTRLRGLFRAYRAQLRFCVRMTLAGLITFALAQMLVLPLHGLWAVLTAIVVTQASAGGSMRATAEYVIGTLGGAVFAAMIGVLIPHTTTLSQAGVLVLAVAPLAFVAAVNPSFRVAPFSAVLVLLISGQLGEGPIGSAFTRFAEVGLGGAVAVAVSLVVFPERAHRLGVKSAVRILEELGRYVPQLLTAFTGGLDADENRRRQDEIGRGLAEFQAIVDEVKHEPFARFVAEADPGPLSRTLLRLRHDLVIIGRAAGSPLTDSVAQRLGPLLLRLGSQASDFLHQCATALSLRRPPPSLEPVETALHAYTSEVSALRSEGATRVLATDEAERLFALGFALEELYRNFCDLERCVKDYARQKA